MANLDPIWNKQIKEFDRALDPLGVNKVNDRMMNELLRGITTLTSRARYYSFYVWVIDQIRKKKLASTLSQFYRAFSDIVFFLSFKNSE